MKIAITSGKGGVGKTFAATCLADVLSEAQPVSLIDCDVEAPNSHLFIDVENPEHRPEYMPCVESVNEELCTLCGKCARACYFNALVVGRKSVSIFNDLCRGCGACQIVCIERAIVPGMRVIGTFNKGKSKNITLSWATLKAGSGGMTTALIDRLKQQDTEDMVILDSPPGTSCPVVHSVRDADRVVLVTDPTPFSMHDLKLSVGMCAELGIKPLVLINRKETGDIAKLRKWCVDKDLPIVGEIPESREVAFHYSKGELVTQKMPQMREMFKDIAREIVNISLDDSKVPDIDVNYYLSDVTERINPAENEPASDKPFELTVVSGKGGSGKTSLSACFAKLSGGIAADCDVDAADMHLLFKPEVIEAHDFAGGRIMHIDADACLGCGRCFEVCRFEAIEKMETGTYKIREEDCEGCGACSLICPAGAVESEITTDGRWYFSRIRSGVMSHATLSPGLENSGKLVSRVRNNASARYVQYGNNKPVVMDGAPGTGCPVIASLTGTDYAVMVTEPTVSGLHDLERIQELAGHFGLACGIVVNKHDINEEYTAKIEDFAEKAGIEILGRLPYSPLFNQAQKRAETVIEFAPESAEAKEIFLIWNKILIHAQERQKNV
ncbi:Ferredoxin [Limihaloglobus sulfuriphilus]|uniref:Ferredoxin n=1 Tax=Limihaloglobus sulfuriphilus TaxID=1851148 RepID=A0A1Q2MC71_9BACT|nr:P-loop NTPase [Limihaloglobus sulfuriphilus]AQQ70313.1 Ferredoxin [Limihaloglobus sulfuriphilus]